MLFSDDNERLYVYGCNDSSAPGITGAELDADNPVQLITPIKTLISFSPSNKWECFGEWNQNKRLSYMEGPLCTKGTAYIT